MKPNWTRTRKLRRGALHEKYHELLEAIYGGRRQVHVSAEVRYRDGRTGTVSTELAGGGCVNLPPSTQRTPRIARICRGDRRAVSTRPFRSRASIKTIRGGCR